MVLNQEHRVSNHMDPDQVLESRYRPASVTLEDAQAAYDAWGANCGPGALAAALDKTLGEVRPHLLGFDAKRYTNPTMMLNALRQLGVRWKDVPRWPTNGLVRVQWGGPWLRPGVPIAARYRHTHWIATRLTGDELRAFDINGACVGWMPFEEWSGRLVPWLLGQVAPRNDGTWHATHRLELAE